MNYPDTKGLYQGKFTDGDPVAGIPASIASADHMNTVYDELTAAIVAGGVVPDANDVTQLAHAIGKQLRSKRLLEVSGTANAIMLTTPEGQRPVTGLSDYDEFSFIVAATNTDVVTIQIDSLAAVPLSGVVSDTQVFETALLTVQYIAGSFYIVNQINPKTGNPVALIGNLITSPFAAVGACKMRFDAGDLSRYTHPILFAKAQKTGLIDQAIKDADLQTYGGFWGDGDGATTFTSPIYDGAFVRFSDNGRGLDVGRELGSWQGDAIRNVVGNFGNIAYQSGQVGGSGRGAFIGETGVFGNTHTVNNLESTTGDGIGFDASRVVPTADDNRPMNYAVNSEFLV
ncbi:hypothetical protein [Marinomonas transparens]|uniref:Uncharacterized protein n=1 Tax=Marinomonas transparens TaxID=2795388 RepID=A0A934JJW7_9GAMM|nr:hypothetical protein [Marinomonas transparens]MBJ7537151.1 hypothetical protein [Marinomonas transparens]